MIKNKKINVFLLGPPGVPSSCKYIFVYGFPTPLTKPPPFPSGFLFTAYPLKRMSLVLLFIILQLFFPRLFQLLICSLKSNSYIAQAIMIFFPNNIFFHYKNLINLNSFFLLLVLNKQKFDTITINLSKKFVIQITFPYILALTKPFHSL